MGKLKAMEEELERGRELAKQLRELLMMKKKTSFDNSSNKGKVCGAEDLVANVMASFTNTLFLLNNNNTHLINNLSSSSSSSFSIIIPSNSQDSQLSTSNNPTSPPTPSHKRRKSSHSWEQVSEISTTDDGHAWRKYGQKMILNNKHPRNYYRCTHKFDQGCKATKQVQRIQDEPPLYRTTYYGHHTCTNFLNPHIILDSPHPHHLSNSNSSFLLSFSDHHHKTNTNNNIPIPNPFISSSISSSFPNPIQDNNTTYNDSNNNVPSSSLFSTHQYDYGDLISSPLFYDHPDLLLHHHDDDLDALIFDPYEL